MYSVAFHVAAFFPASSTGALIGSQAVGVVFGAYPFATFFATPLPPLVIRACGVGKTVACGLLVVSVSTALFGVSPALLTRCGPIALTAALTCCRAVGGVGAALSEAACLTAISTSGWHSDLGKALASVEVMTGLAASFGSAVGGALFEAGSATAVGSFAFPCLTMAMLPLAAAPVALALLPAKTNLDLSSHPSMSLLTLLTPARASTAVSIVAAALVCEALNPLLEPHLLAAPHAFSVAQVGLFFAAICACYTSAAPLCGYCVDRLQVSDEVAVFENGCGDDVGGGANGPFTQGRHTDGDGRRADCGSADGRDGMQNGDSTDGHSACCNGEYSGEYCEFGGTATSSSEYVAVQEACSRRHARAEAGGAHLKRFMACGWLGSVCGHALIGPLADRVQGVGTLASVGTGLESGEMAASLPFWLSPTALSWLSTLLLGSTAALLIVPSLPDLQAGLHPDDEESKLAVCAAWNGLYSLGSGVGPSLGSAFFSLVGFSGTCGCLMLLGLVMATILLLTAEWQLVSAKRRGVRGGS